MPWIAYAALGLVLLLLLLVGGFFLLRRYLRGPTKGSDNPKRLDGRVVVITGANSGIGKVTAEELYARGARVIMLCRSETRAAAAIADIKSKLQLQGREEGSLEAEKMDLSSLESIRECGAVLLKKLDKIDILINNAGIGRNFSVHMN